MHRNAFFLGILYNTVDHPYENNKNNALEHLQQHLQLRLTIANEIVSAATILNVGTQ